MKKFLFFIGFLSCFSFISFSSVYAEVSSVVKAQETSNSIELSWNLEGDTYKIYRDQELIWEGKDKGYVDDTLEANHLYSYRIGSYDKDGSLIGVTNIKTRTKPVEFRAFNTSPLDNGELSTKFTTTVGSDYVHLEWGNLEDKDGIYEIYRDDKLIGKTDELFYFDDTVAPGKTYKYSVESKKEVSKQEKEEMEEYIETNNLEVSQEEKEELFTQPHSLIRLIETNEEVSSEQELKSKDLPSFILEHEKKMKSMGDASTSAIKYSMLFRYTTFIPEATVSPPVISTTYKGDDRDFDFYSDSYRTRSDVFAGWANGNELNIKPYTGITTQYKNGQTNTKKASTAGIKLTKDLVSSNKIMWRVNHDIGDPFLALFPNINIFYEGTLYNNYSIEVRGSHDRAPNHEFYFALAYTEDTPTSIFKFTGGSLTNLIPGAKQRYFEFSI